MGDEAAGGALEERIRQARHVSIDGGAVLYDLTHGMDFSKSRETAEAGVRVLWDEDGAAWWTVQGEDVKFTPNHGIEIRLPDEHNRRIAKTVEEFKADLKNTELALHLSGQLSPVSGCRVGWAPAILMGPSGPASRNGPRSTSAAERKSSGSIPRCRTTSPSRRNRRCRTDHPAPRREEARKP